MTIRPLIEEDLYFIAEEKKNFSDGWNYDMLVSSFKASRLFGFIAEENGEKTGFITYSVLPPDADVISVYVKKEKRNRGIAAALIFAAIKDVKNMGGKKIFLEVRESNFPAINLYAKFGFIQISVRKKYYGDENALVFSKEL